MSVDTGDTFDSQDIINDLSGDTGQGDFVQPSDSSPTTEIPQNTGEQPNVPQNDNPAWKPYLDKFEPAMHDKVREVLADLDSQVQRRFERTSQLEKNYGEFARANVDPRMIQAGIQLFQNLNNDPQTFYQRLGESLGISAQQAEDLVNEDDDVDPAYAQMQQQMEQMNQFLTQQQEFQREQQFQREVQEESQKLNDDLGKIKEKFNFSDSDMQSVIQRTIFITQTQNPNATVFDGLQMFLNERKEWERSRPANTAPSVIAGNGSAVAPPSKPVTEMTDKEFKNDIVAALQNM